MSAGPTAGTSRGAEILDFFITSLLAVTAVLQWTGGGVTTIAGIEVSARTPTRPLTAALLLIAIRLWHWPRTPPLGMTSKAWLGLRRLAYRPDLDRAMDRPAFTWAQVGWATLGLCLVGCVLLRLQLEQMYSVPDLGDPLFSIWRFGWFFHWLHGDPRSLFSPNIFYPHPLALTYSDSMLLPSLMVSPLLSAGMHPVIAYNLLFMSGFLLSGIAMFMLAAHLTRSPMAAFIAALLFAFYPYRFEHYSHLELQMTQWMPLALLSLHRFAETTKIRFAFAAVAAAIAQLYSSMYYGVFFTLYVVPVVAILFFNRRESIKMWRGAAVAAVLGVACAIPLVRPYMAAQAARGERDTNVVTFYSAKPSDYFEAHDRSALYRELIPSKNPERALFPGVMALGLATTALVPPYGLPQVVYGVALAIGWETSLGFHGVIYPQLYKWLSPMRGLRVAARYSVIVGMTLALLSAFGARRLFSLVKSPTGRAVMLGVLTTLIAVDVHPRLELVPVWRSGPAIYAALPTDRPVVLAEFPFRQHTRGFTESLPFMYFALGHWTNMVNGYSGFSPADYNDLAERAEKIPSTDAIAALRAAQVTHVTLNCGLHDDPKMCDTLMDQLAHTPQFKQVAEVIWLGRPVRLYEMNYGAG